MVFRSLRFRLNNPLRCVVHAACEAHVDSNSGLPLSNVRTGYVNFHKMNRKLVQTYPLAEAGLELCHSNTRFEGEHSTSALEKHNINTGVQGDDKHANPPVLASAGTPEFKQHYCE